MAEYPDLDNSYTFTLEAETQPLPAGVASPAYQVDSNGIADMTSYRPVANYEAPGAKVQKPISQLAEKIIVWDTETTGTNPTNTRMIVASFWDLSKPISTMETFAGFDEEKLTHEIADYLNQEKPTIMVCYNNGFDQRYVLTRFMLYQTPVPGWNQIKQIDVMDILKKGTTQSIASSQAPLAEEAWFEYFFGEKKPYDIEQCFEGVRAGDLEPMIIRNRTCTASEGWLYLLFREMTDAEPFEAVENRPTVTTLDDEQDKGICVVNCPACKSQNTVDCGSSDNTCYRCLGRLPDPTKQNIIKEKLRDYDFSKVGLKDKK